MTLFICLLAFIMSDLNTAVFASESMKVKPETLLTGLGIPWSIEFLDNQTLIFSERSGKIKTYHLQSKTLTNILGAPISAEHGQGGLLDLHRHPEFAKNKTLYLSYTKKISARYTTALSMAQLEGAELKSLKEIFVANNPSAKGEHFGARMAHDDNDHLYFTVGDRNSRDLAQKLDADQGKVHRIKLDGTIPSDNPFFTQLNARKTIWSYGHRNPQGLVYDFANKVLWESEHGPRGGDEINKIEKGRNYGWPVITYGREYWGPRIGRTRQAGMEQPVYYYVPSIAPCGLELYQGGLFSGALALTHLNRLDFKKNQWHETRILTEIAERIRDVKLGPDGLVYFSTDSGKIIRVDLRK